RPRTPRAATWSPRARPDAAPSSLRVPGAAGARALDAEAHRAELAEEALAERRVAVSGEHRQVAEDALELLAVLAGARPDRAVQVLLDGLPHVDHRLARDRGKPRVLEPGVGPLAGGVGPAQLHVLL